MIIDLGCGYLKYPATFDKPHLKIEGVIGVDVCKYNNDLIADALHTPFKNGTADMVVMRQFLEHVDSQSLIREAWRILKPNGKLLLETPNALYIFKVLKALRGKEANPHIEHIQTFSAPELRNLLRRNGFKNVEISYHNVKLVNPYLPLLPIKKCITYFQEKLFPMFSRDIVVYSQKDLLAKFEEYIKRK